MPLTLHYHPLSSFCWKALIALYEKDLPFTPHLVNLGDPTEAAALRALWPFTKFPVLHDDSLGRTVAESSILIEFLDQHHPGKIQLIPGDQELALATRLWDRVCDLQIHIPMQKVVGNNLRPADAKDQHGVDHAKATINVSYGYLESQLGTSEWAIGSTFSMADCAAAPALYYANRVAPMGNEHPKVAAYLERLKLRPSFARVLEEAAPYFAMFPGLACSTLGRAASLLLPALDREPFEPAKVLRVRGH